MVIVRYCYDIQNFFELIYQNHMTPTNTSIASPTATGGEGIRYENLVQSFFVLSMLIEDGVHGFPNCVIERIQLQGRTAGFQTDDCILFLKNTNLSTEHKYLVSVKKTLSFTKSNEDFRDSLAGMWTDFKNGAVFDPQTDKFAIVTSNLSQTDHNDFVQGVLSFAKHSNTLEELNQKLQSSSQKQEKLAVVKEILQEAYTDTLSDSELLQFLKCLEIIVFDENQHVAVAEGRIRRTINTTDPRSVWNIICQEVSPKNSSAGLITRETISDNLKNTFNSVPSQMREAWHRLNSHKDLIFKTIQTEIADVHIDRSAIVQQVNESVAENKITFITGVPGTGKSAILKESLSSLEDNAKVICLRAEDFRKNSIEAMFQSLGINIPLDTLSSGLSIHPKLVWIIESLEKILETDDKTAFRDLLTLVHEKESWVILASCREYAVDTIIKSFEFLDGNKIAVPEFTQAEFGILSERLPILQNLCEHESIAKLLQNPFVANIAQKLPGVADTHITTVSDFKKAVWSRLIAKDDVQKDGQHMKRHQVFTAIAVDRAKSFSYSVSASKYDASILHLLESDGLILLDETLSRVYLAHDVLEDWALEAFIESKFSAEITPENFFAAIGSERGIQRAFRFWVIGKLKSNESNFLDFVVQILNSEATQAYWKDETMIAILTGGLVANILPSIAQRMTCGKTDLFSRICLLLRCACTTIDPELSDKITNDNDYVKFFTFMLKPAGEAWQTVIQFVLSQCDSCRECHTPITTSKMYADFIGVVKEYARVIKQPKDENQIRLARQMGQFAIAQLTTIQQGDNVYRFSDSGLIDLLVETAILLCGNIKNEITKFVENSVLSHEIRDVSDCGKKFVQAALMGNDRVWFVSKHPELVKQIIRHAVHLPPKKDFWDSFSSRGVADEFGVHDIIGNEYSEEQNSFSPASTSKGPFLALLTCEPVKGIDFIVDLLNDAAKSYFESSLDDGEKYMINLPLNNGQIIQQYCSPRLWFAHREHHSPYAPGVVQNMLMALEFVLVDLLESNEGTLELVAKLVKRILVRSNSVMTTSLLTSLATGFPCKFLDAALPFLRVKEFYELDFQRSWQERHVPQIAHWPDGIHGSNDPAREIYGKEREIALNYKWRKNDIAGLAYYLQVTSCRQQVLEIIDKFKNALTDKDEDSYLKTKLPLIDRRNAVITENPEKDQIIIGPPPQKQTPEQLENLETVNNFNRLVTIEKWAEKAIYNNIGLPDSSDSAEAFVADLKGLQVFLQTVNAAFLQKSIYLGSAVILRWFCNDICEASMCWCWQQINDILSMTANDRDAVTRRVDIYGVLDIVKVLPTFFDTNCDAELTEMRQFIAFLLTCDNVDIRGAAGVAVRTYLWATTPSFAEHCLRGAYHFSQAEKKYPSHVRRVEQNEKIFHEKKDKIRESIVNETTENLPHDFELEVMDSWFLLPVLNTLPFTRKTTSHEQLLDAATNLYLDNIDNHNRRQNGQYQTLSNELSLNLPYLLGEHCFYSETVIDQLSFGKILIDHFDDSLSIIKSLLSKMLALSDEHKKYDLFWDNWNVIASVTKCKIVAGINEGQTRDKSTQETFIDSLFCVDYWNDAYKEELYTHLCRNRAPFVETIRETIEHPDVFNAFVRLLNALPDLFGDDAIDILLMNFTISDAPPIDYVQSPTTRYKVECYVNSLLRKRNEKVTQKISGIIGLLDRLIGKCSPCAFFMREEFLSKKPSI